eukprot:m.145222 g.145222  ORF g.145222 m.145222 type:complete len:67 (-) comp16215_c0_seq8:1189-1389(-)
MQLNQLQVAIYTADQSDLNALLASENGPKRPSLRLYLAFPCVVKAVATSSCNLVATLRCMLAAALA